MITNTEPIEALNALRCCRSRLLETRLDALSAATALSGVRANRARELAHKLADVLVHCERLTFIVEGDLCADALDPILLQHDSEAGQRSSSRTSSSDCQRISDDVMLQIAAGGDRLLLNSYEDVTVLEVCPAPIVAASRDHNHRDRL